MSHGKFVRLQNTRFNRAYSVYVVSDFSRSFSGYKTVETEVYNNNSDCQPKSRTRPLESLLGQYVPWNTVFFLMMPLTKPPSSGLSVWLVKTSRVASDREQHQTIMIGSVCIVTRRQVPHTFHTSVITYLPTYLPYVSTINPAYNRMGLPTGQKPFTGRQTKFSVSQSRGTIRPHT